MCGVVSLKQLILKVDSPDFKLKDVVAKPVFFPEAMSVYDALDRMKEKKLDFALVCDEFGDMTGVITPSDILEGLVGTMPQQQAATYIVKNADGDSWTINAQIPIYDFLNYFDLEDLYRPASYATLGGLILEELKHLPEKGEKLDWHNLSLEIASMDGAKIGDVVVKFIKK